MHYLALSTARSIVKHRSIIEHGVPIAHDIKNHYTIVLRGIRLVIRYTLTDLLPDLPDNLGIPPDVGFLFIP